jgi:hypothetical protein
LALGNIPDGIDLVVANVAAAGLREHDPSLLGKELSQLVSR